jgi:hypothetical protein
VPRGFAAAIRGGQAGDASMTSVLANGTFRQNLLAGVGTAQGAREASRLNLQPILGVAGRPATPHQGAPKRPRESSHGSNASDLGKVTTLTSSVNINGARGNLSFGPPFMSPHPAPRNLQRRPTRCVLIRRGTAGNGRERRRRRQVSGPADRIVLHPASGAVSLAVAFRQAFRRKVIPSGVRARPRG